MFIPMFPFGCGGEGFPYTNFHDMNMDWVIKVVTDFLMKYADIQKAIDEGVSDLTDKTTELEGLLQSWYDTHSEDIATQLANSLIQLDAWYNEHKDDISDDLEDALTELDSSIALKVQQALASIPSDYTEVYNMAHDSYSLSYTLTTALPSGADLNDYTVAGNFRIATAAIAQSLSNYPASVGGRLSVMTIAGTGSIYQHVIDVNNREYTRQKTGQGWSDWQTWSFPVITSFAFAKDIPASSDLNSYTTPGNYKIATTAIAETLLNTPSRVSGRLTVMTLVGTNSVHQHLIDTNHREYTRQYSSSGWSDWKSTSFNLVTSFAYTTVIPDNDNLDDYITPGNYRVANVNSARTISNYPSGVAGKIAVMTITGTNSVLQIVCDTEGRTYTRTKSLLGWSVWNVLQDDNNKLQKIGARTVHNAIRPVLLNQQYNVAFANAPASIDMLNYIGNDQNVHPKVLYFSNGFGGHTYWMAYTPYPYSFDRFENPCIAYSDDGIHWHNIENNPIDTPVDGGYYSDTHLVYVSNRLECWYRKVDPETANPRKETIMRKTSTNGLTWSNAENVLVNDSGDYAKFLSPAIFYDNSKYCMWVVNGDSSPVSIDYYESSSIPSWTKIRTITLTLTDTGTNLYPWHIDVIKVNGQYVLLVMGRNDTTKGSKWTLFMATSNDNITYSTPTVVIRGSGGWDEYIYRACIVRIANAFRIYYSAGGNGNPESDSIYNRAIWGIGITESETLTGFIGK